MPETNEFQERKRWDRAHRLAKYLTGLGFDHNHAATMTDADWASAARACCVPPNPPSAVTKAYAIGILAPNPGDKFYK